MSTAQAPPVTISLAGDVMTGRGVDQIMPHPSSPELREAWVQSATTYVELAEEAHGPMALPLADATTETNEGSDGATR